MFGLILISIHSNLIQFQFQSGWYSMNLGRFIVDSCNCIKSCAQQLVEGQVVEYDTVQWNTVQCSSWSKRSFSFSGKVHHFHRINFFPCKTYCRNFQTNIENQNFEQKIELSLRMYEIIRVPPPPGRLPSSQGIILPKLMHILNKILILDIF